MARRKGWFKRRFKIKLKKEAVYSIAYLILFCLAFLIILSFTRQGELLFTLNVNLSKYFGWGTIFVVFFLMLSGLMLTKFNVPWNQASVMVGGGLSSLSLMGLTRSGLVGRGIFEQIAYFLTPIGSILILIVCSLIGFVVLFNTSLDQIVFGFADFFRAVKGIGLKPKKD
ncbi:hypothetical protein KKA69_02490, partial [Patescibacteria group bacterium]|nr:hypothetical protein [Patescibacteria group bacterium]